jgi:hypothetical protein
MANDLKASVSITADTSGLISGVNGAMEKINKISSNTSMMAGMMGASKVIDLAKQLWDAMGERSDHLSKLAHTFSPEAMTSAANLSQSQMKSDMAVGQAMGPAQAGIDRAKQDAIAEETANTLKNAEEIGNGMIVLNAIWDQTKAIAIGATDASLADIGSLTESNLAELGTLQAGAMANSVSAGQTDGRLDGVAILQWMGDIVQNIASSVKGD